MLSPHIAEEGNSAAKRGKAGADSKGDKLRLKAAIKVKGEVPASSAAVNG